MSEPVFPVSKPQTPAPVKISTGAGIAIAGIWMSAAVLDIAIWVLFYLADRHDPTPAQTVTSEGALVLIVILFLPLIVAYFATKRVLGQQDE